MSTAFIDRLNAGAGLLVTAGWNHFLQTTLLALLLGLIDATFGRRAGPHWRCALWLIFFAKLALPPQLALPSSPAYWSYRFAPAPAATPMAASMPTAPAAQSWARGSEGNPMPRAQIASARASAAAPTRPSWPLWVVAGWFVGVATMAAATYRQRRRAHALLEADVSTDPLLQAALEHARRQVGLGRPVRLRVTGSRLGPMVTGLWRPTVYLPRSLADELTDPQLHAVLVHELMHVKRGDLWVTALQTTARLLFFYHPAVWWVNAHVSRLREEATDRAVLSHPEVDVCAYSLALVIAVEVGQAPLPRFALGVIETKSQLKKRILMNLSHPRSRRAHLGHLGLLSITTLGLLLIPMAPAGSPSAPTPAGFNAIAADPLVRQIDAASEKIFAAFNRRDRDAYERAFTADTLILPPGSPLLASTIGVGESYLQAPAELQYEKIRWRDRQIHRIGAWVIDTGLADLQFRLHPGDAIMTDPRQALTIWAADKGDDLQVKVLAWSPLSASSGANGNETPQAFVFAGPVTPFAPAGDFSAVLRAEETFHHAFEAREPKRAADYYTEGAILLSPEAGPVRGHAAIQRLFESAPADHSVQKIERKVVRVEGNATHVLVVNVFRWTFTPPGATAPISIAGKGVHVWQLDPDGVWRILFDLPNPSQPSAT